MDVREKLNALDQRWVIAGAGVCLLIAVATIASSLRGPGTPGWMKNTTPLLCTRPECGRASQATWQQIKSQQGSDPTDRNFPAMKCPACGHNSLALAAKCPNDGAVFHVALGGKCPKCGWDPAADAAARIAESLKK